MAGLNDGVDRVHRARARDDVDGLVQVVDCYLAARDHRRRIAVKMKMRWGQDKVLVLYK